MFIVQRYNSDIFLVHHAICTRHLFYWRTVLEQTWKVEAEDISDSSHSEVLEIIDVDYSLFSTFYAFVQCLYMQESFTDLGDGRFTQVFIINQGLYKAVAS